MFLQRSDATHGLWCGSTGKRSDDAGVRAGVGKSGDTAGTKEETKEKSGRQEKGSAEGGFFSFLVHKSAHLGSTP